MVTFREQASNFKAQVALAEEREKLRESEANTKNCMFVQRKIAISCLKLQKRN
jgi:hypothetical protein